MENNRNFFITIALSVLILTLWQVFYMNPRVEAQREAAKLEQQRVEEQKKAAGAGTASPAGTGAPVAQGGIPNTPGTDGTTPASLEQALAATARVKIDTPSLSGSINLTGARLDDLKLKHYTETVDKNSPRCV